MNAGNFLLMLTQRIDPTKTEQHFIVKIRICQNLLHHFGQTALIFIAFYCVHCIC